MGAFHIQTTSYYIVNPCNKCHTLSIYSKISIGSYIFNIIFRFLIIRKKKVMLQWFWRLEKSHKFPPNNLSLFHQPPQEDKVHTTLLFCKRCSSVLYPWRPENALMQTFCSHDKKLTRSFWLIRIILLLETTYVQKLQNFQMTLIPLWANLATLWQFYWDTYIFVNNSRQFWNLETWLYF